VLHEAQDFSKFLNGVPFLQISVSFRTLIGRPR
jgi:hypothetical protein